MVAVLTPKWRGALARLHKERRGSWAKLLLFLVSGGLFWATVAWGIVDAVVHFRPEVPLDGGPPSVRARAQPQVRLRIAPTVVGSIDPTLGAGLQLRF